MSINFEPLKQSGVSYEEFGKLCKVSKIAVYKWTKGGGVDSRHAARILKLVNALSAALDAGDLPLPPRTPRSAREKMIQQALVKQLRKD